jgi:TPR repeat protein
MLILGEGTGKDIEKGLWWIEQAAEKGEVCAARPLSDIYQKGLFEIEADAEKERYWKKKYNELEGIVQVDR